MYKAFLIKYGEIGVKGKNRFIFEDALVRQIKFSLKDVEGEFDVRRADGRIYVNALSDYDYDEVIESLTRVFGIVGICPVVQIEDTDLMTLLIRLSIILIRHIRIRILHSRLMQEEQERIIQ